MRVHVVGHDVAVVVVGGSRRIVLLHVQVLLLLQMLQGIFGAEQCVGRHHQVIPIRQLGPVDRSRLQGDRSGRRGRRVTEHHSTHVGRNGVATVLSSSATAPGHCKGQSHHLLSAQRLIPGEPCSARGTSLCCPGSGHLLQNGRRHISESLGKEIFVLYFFNFWLSFSSHLKDHIATFAKGRVIGRIYWNLSCEFRIKL